MELLATVDGYHLQKIRRAAQVAKIELKVTTGLTDEALTALHSQAKSVLLKTSSGYITQHNAILRHIAEASSVSGLYGSTTFENAQVDQWLDFTWNEIDVPLHLCLALEAAASSDHRANVLATAGDALQAACNVLNAHLESRTYVAAERVTVADISIAEALAALQPFNIITLSSFPFLLRYFNTVQATAKPVAPAVGVAVPGGKWGRGRIRIKELLQQGADLVGQEVLVKGWIRTTRDADKKRLLFVELTDGSTVKGVQLVFEAGVAEGMEAVSKCGGVGASLAVVGQVVASPAKGQPIEIKALRGDVLGAVFGGANGEVGGKNYPLAKKGHGLEYLRDIAHLRPRSKVFSCVLRMRHAMAFATHEFFNTRGFVYTHTPFITAADCEGAGEQFVVSTLLGDKAKPSDLPVTPSGEIDFSKDFFGKRCCLTVSGQLNVETHACALTDVYTFGPTFRAENSHTSRHLAEFWMIEPEICFADLEDDMALAEDYIKYCAKYALEHCADDLHYLEHEFPLGEKGLRDRLVNVVESDFIRLTYTAAVELLQQEIAAGKVTFEKYPNWGDDLGSEHERYITEKVYMKPTIVTNYPKGIKAFYMRLNDDNATVAAMDILVPKIGEIIGGSQREERLDVLITRCKESGLHPEDLWWYLDLRRYGSVQHAGFGLGFERLIMFVTGLENIRDVISFPRVPGKAEF